MVVAYGADEYPLTLNRERLGRYPLNAGICEPLVRLTDDFAVAPGLATRWEFRAPNTYRFFLRSDVTFTDGARFDARAAAHTFAEAAGTRNDYSFLSDSSVRVVDDTTLDIEPTRENRRLVDQLVHPTYGLVSPVATQLDGPTAPVPSA